LTELELTLIISSRVLVLQREFPAKFNSWIAAGVLKKETSYVYESEGKEAKLICENCKGGYPVDLYESKTAGKTYRFKYGSFPSHSCKPKVFCGYQTNDMTRVSDSVIYHLKPTPREFKMTSLPPPPKYTQRPLSFAPASSATGSGTLARQPDGEAIGEEAILLDSDEIPEGGTGHSGPSHLLPAQPDVSDIQDADAASSVSIPLN
jgi:hypothetical protein